MRLYPRQKKNGERVWWASWNAGHRRTVRRSTGCATKAAAELVVARWERERADPVYAAANDAAFGEEARLFLSACADAVKREKMAEGTLTMYRQKAGTLVRLLGAHLNLASIDGETFASYLLSRREDYRASTVTDVRPTGKAITESTLYKEWVTFHGILRQAWRGQRFGRDPRSLKPPHFGPEYKPRETALTWPQLKLLLMSFPEERRKTLAFALATGARRKEIFAAMPGDVSKLSAKLRGTKTEAASATIPIPSLMHELLAMAGEPPYRSWGNARRDIGAHCLKAGVPVVTWNDLRRTFASLLVQAGVAPHLVAKLLRHKSTAMVDKVYGRQTPESLTHLIEGQLAATAPPPAAPVVDAKDAALVEALELARKRAAVEEEWDTLEMLTEQIKRLTKRNILKLVPRPKNPRA